MLVASQVSCADGRVRNQRRQPVAVAIGYVRSVAVAIRHLDAVSVRHLDAVAVRHLDAVAVSESEPLAFEHTGQPEPQSRSEHDFEYATGPDANAYGLRDHDATQAGNPAVVR